MTKKTFSLPHITSYDSFAGEMFTDEIKKLSIKAEQDEKRESPDSAFTDKEEVLLEDLNSDILNYIDKLKSQLLDVEEIIIKAFPIKSYAEAKDFYELLDNYILELRSTNQAADLPGKHLKDFKDTIQLFFESRDKLNHDKKFHELSCKFTRIFNILSLKTGAFSPNTLNDLSDIILQTIQQILSEIDLHKKTTGLMLFPERYINTISKLNTEAITAMLIYSKIKPKLNQPMFKHNISEYLDRIKIRLDTLDMSIVKVNLYPVIADFNSILLCPEEDIVQIKQPWTLKIDPKIFPNEYEILNQINGLYDQLQIQSQNIILINNFLAQIDQDSSTSSAPQLTKHLLSNSSNLKTKSSKLIHLFAYFSKF